MANEKEKAYSEDPLSPSPVPRSHMLAHLLSSLTGRYVVESLAGCIRDQFPIPSSYIGPPFLSFQCMYVVTSLISVWEGSNMQEVCIETF